MNRRELEDAMVREVEFWPGVSIEFVEGGKHPKVRLTFDGNMLSRPYPGTPGSSFALSNTLGDVRRMAKQLGAQRDRPEPSREEDEAAYRKPNDGAAKRPDPVRTERAPVQPDLGDQLVSAGVVTREAVQAEKSADTYARRQEVEALAPASDADREAELAELEAAIAAIGDGVYFDLPDRIYHAVAALGSGSISDLLVSPGDFWRGSWLDPDRPELDEEATKAQILGKAYHCARLEAHRFDDLYCCELDRAAMPKGTLFGAKEMEAELVERGLKKSGSVLEQAIRLAEDGFPEDRLWHLALERWRKDLNGRVPLAAKFWNDIRVDMERIAASPEIAEKLVGGAAEVSVFWTDAAGIRCKARFDYLRHDLWVDFKTFENMKRKFVNQTIADAFRYNRYYIQACHYRDAVEAVRAGLEIRSEADDDKRALIAAIQAQPAPLQCWYVFQQKGGVPNLLAKRFRFSAIDTQREYEIRAIMRDGTEAERDMAREALASETLIARRGRYEIEQAKSLFVTYSQVYQPGEPWAPLDPIGEIGDSDFSPYWLEGRDS